MIDLIKKQRNGKLILWLLFSLFTAIVISGCGGGGTESVTHFMTSKQVGTLGDTVTFGKAKITIPEGALGEDTQVTIAKVEPPAEEDETVFKVLGNTYHFEAGDGTFDKAVTISLPYNQADIPLGLAEEDIYAQYFDGEEWIIVGGTVDTVANLITIETTHLSEWNISCASFVAGENPDTPNTVENVPYYRQDLASWCLNTSSMMLLKHYGVDKELWDIACHPVVQQAAGETTTVKKIADYVGTLDLTPVVKKFAPYSYSAFARYLRYNLAANRPVLVCVTDQIKTMGEPLKHFFVVVGFSDTGVCLHDPSGDVASKIEGEHVSGKPYCEVTWSSFAEMISSWVGDSVTGVGKIGTLLFKEVSDCVASTRIGTIHLKEGSVIRAPDDMINLYLRFDGKTHTAGYYFYCDGDVSRPDDTYGENVLTEMEAELAFLVSNSSDESQSFLLSVKVTNAGGTSIQGSECEVTTTVSANSGGKTIAISPAISFPSSKYSTGSYTLVADLFCNDVLQDSLCLTFNIANTLDSEGAELNPVELSQPGEEDIEKTSVDLTWTESDSSKFQRYEIYGIKGEGSVDPEQATLYTQISAKSTTSYTVSGLTKDTIYSFRIFVLSTDGFRAGSETIEITTLPDETKGNPPNPVVLDDPYNSTTSSLSLTWSINTDIDFYAYKVYMATHADVTVSDTLVTTITNAATVTYTVTSLDPETTYYFKIIVEDTEAETDSSASNETSGTTLSESAGEPEQPEIITETLADAVAGDAYTATLEVENGTPPYKWKILGSIPVGITIEETSGIISGIPSESAVYHSLTEDGEVRESYDLTVQVKDFAGQSAEKEFSLKVEAKWTFMVFMNADNNLEELSICDVNSMELAGSSGSINIIIQLDRVSWNDLYNKMFNSAIQQGASEYEADRVATDYANQIDDTTNGNWSTCKRFYITKDSDVCGIHSIELQELGEVNMGAVDVLQDFASWGVENYPAEKFSIVLWNHGDAWRTCSNDDNDGSTSPKEDALNAIKVHQALDNAIEEINGTLGIGDFKFDLIMYVMCLMGSVEMHYQIADLAKICVASEELITFKTGTDLDIVGSVPFYRIISTLLEEPNITERQLGIEIADHFRDIRDLWSESSSNFQDYTISVVDLEKLSSFITEFADLISAMQSTIVSDWFRYGEAREKSDWYCQDFDERNLIDLRDFALKLSQITNDGSVKTKATTVANSLSENSEGVIIKNYVGARHVNSYGLSIYFPSANAYYDYNSLYESLSFANSGWPELLQAYFHQQASYQQQPSIQNLVVSGYGPFNLQADIIGDHIVETNFVINYLIDDKYYLLNSIPILSWPENNTRIEVPGWNGGIIMVTDGWNNEVAHLNRFSSDPGLEKFYSLNALYYINGISGSIFSTLVFDIETGYFLGAVLYVPIVVDDQLSFVAQYWQPLIGDRIQPLIPYYDYTLNDIFFYQGAELVNYGLGFSLTNDQLPMGFYSIGFDLTDITGYYDLETELILFIPSAAKAAVANTPTTQKKLRMKNNIQTQPLAHDKVPKAFLRGLKFPNPDKVFVARN